MTIQTETVKGIKYVILAETELTGKGGEGAFSHLAMLQKPRGKKEFLAMRQKHNGTLIILPS